MEKIKKLILNRKKIEIFYPPDEIEKWKMLKRRYLTLGYIWVDFSTNQGIWKILSADSKNNRKYNKMKRKNDKLRRTFSGHGNYPTIISPPEPNNEERYMMLKRWSENDIYNICMITDYLTRNHNLKPIRDYEPNNLKHTYNLYSEISHPREIIRSNTYHGNSPSAPPLVSLSIPPSYKDVIS